MPTDDINPMHKIGHGRGDDLERPPRANPIPRRSTMAYSFVEPREKTHVVESVPTVKDAPTTIQDVMTRLVEKDFDAWMRLPESVRKLMVTCPADFTLTASEGSVPNITHCGIEFSFDGGSWVLVGIK